MAAAKPKKKQSKNRVPHFGDPSVESKTLVLLLIATALILLVPLTQLLVN